MFRSLFYKLFFFIYKIVFKFNSVNYGDVIYIYDIDNTICNTGYRSNYQGFLDKDLVNNLEVFIPIKNKILNQYKYSNNIFFFSVRPIKFWLLTFFWLNRNEIKVNIFQLFFFNSPMKKIKFIEYLVNKGYLIEFYDDMSFNHENGKVMFYESEINYLKKLKLNYYGFKYLNLLNKINK